MPFKSAMLLLPILLGGLKIPAANQKNPGSVAGHGATGENDRPFRSAPLRVDTSRLSAGDRQALVKLLSAARILNDVFLQQLWEGNQALYARLQKDTTPLGKARLHYFWLNKSPWSEIDEFKAFLPGVPARKPLGANFYPENMTKEAFERWVDAIGPPGAGTGERLLHGDSPQAGCSASGR